MNTQGWRNRRKLALALTGMALLALQGAPAMARSKRTPPPPPPRLMIVIAIDQFSSEVFARNRADFSGGLKHLSSGISFPRGYQAHAATETCPGHSTILSGRHPRSTGIVANSWYDRDTGDTIYCVAVPGTHDPQARGPQQLRGDTLGAWLKAAQPAARVYSVSGKDRAAIMLAGKKADGVYWWADGEGFATSSYAGPDGPAVRAPATAFNRSFWKNWQADRLKLWPRMPDRCAPLEKPYRFGALEISGKAPPDRALAAQANRTPGKDKAFAADLRASPLLDMATLAFAEHLIETQNLGQGPQTDLLTISLSATDYVGHRYGNAGAEMCGQIANIDDALGSFLDRLQQSGLNYAVVLTADHGAADAAERANDQTPPAFRLDSGQFITDMKAAVATSLGLPSVPLVADSPQEIIITTTDPALKAQIMAATMGWLKKRPEVRGVFTADQVATARPDPHLSPARMTDLQRLYLSYDPVRSGDVFVVFAARTSFGEPHEPGDMIAGHGSVWNHDRQVPILFWWPGIPTRERPEPVMTVDIAPTLAALLNLTPPRIDGRCIALGKEAGVPRCPRGIHPAGK